MSIRQVRISSVKTPRTYNTVSAGFVTISASGGSTSDVSNYNGTGQTWRVHTFTSSSTFTVSLSGTSERNPGPASPAITDARQLVIAGGNNGTYGPGGRAGGVSDTSGRTIPLGSNTVTVGGVATNSSFNGTTASAGTGAPGGNGGSPGYGGTSGTNGPTSTITGSTVYYAGGGGGGGSTSRGGTSPPQGPGNPGGLGGGGNGGGGSDWSSGGSTYGGNATFYGAGGGGAGYIGAGGGTPFPGSGFAGAVIVSYRIA